MCRYVPNNIPSPNGNHNGGDLKFGKDKLLYVSVGDGGCDYAEGTKCQHENDAARDRNILLGKVLRIRRGGGISASNPYTGTNSDRCNEAGRAASGNNCKETFARGFRNPFRMAFDPDATKTSFRINDVGGENWEETDRAQAGSDYGWNLCEGRHDNPYRDGEVNCSGTTYAGPIHEYSHSSGCESTIGGVFVPDGFRPTSYDNSYPFGDYVCNQIFVLTPRAGDGFRRELFAVGLGAGGPVAMGFGPNKTGDKALYYTTFAGGRQVRRIVHTAGNLAPVAAADTVGANYGSSLTMYFDVSGSRDPDDDTPLTYVWDFGDDGGAPTETTDPATSHTYKESEKFTVTLAVRDALGEPTLRQEVRRYHDGNHFHTWSDDPTFVAPPPEGLYSTGPSKNNLQVRLTATDSLGLSKMVSRRLEPRVVDVRFETGPLDLKLGVNGYTFMAPKVLTSWEGYALNVDAERQGDGSGRLWVFDRWSDGRAKAHTIKTPGDPTTDTASFRRV